MEKILKYLLAFIIAFIILGVINPWHDQKKVGIELNMSKERALITSLKKHIYELSQNREPNRDLSLVVLDNRTIILPCYQSKVSGYDTNITAPCGFPKQLSLIDVNGSLRLTNNTDIPKKLKLVEKNGSSKLINTLSDGAMVYELGLFEDLSGSSITSQELSDGTVKIVGAYSEFTNGYWLYNPEDGTILYYVNGKQADYPDHLKY